MLRDQILCALLSAPPIAAAPPAPPPPPPPDTGESDLAAAAPMPEWTFEGGGQAGVEGDAVLARKKVRKAGATAIAGVSVGALGLGTMVAGVLLLGFGSSDTLEETRTDGVLPTNDAKRHRTIAMARVGPPVAAVGAGLLLTGVIVAIIGRKRLKRLREDRRSSTVAFGAMPTRQGATFSAQVRF